MRRAARAFGPLAALGSGTNPMRAKPVPRNVRLDQEQLPGRVRRAQPSHPYPATGLTVCRRDLRYSPAWLPPFAIHVRSLAIRDLRLIVAALGIYASRQLGEGP